MTDDLDALGRAGLRALSRYWAVLLLAALAGGVLMYAPEPAPDNVTAPVAEGESRT